MLAQGLLETGPINEFFAFTGGSHQSAMSQAVDEAWISVSLLMDLVSDLGGEQRPVAASPVEVSLEIATGFLTFQAPQDVAEQKSASNFLEATPAEVGKDLFMRSQ